MGQLKWDNTVAPGSAVAIYGVNLAADVAAAPAGKLAQKLEHDDWRRGEKSATGFEIYLSVLAPQVGEGAAEPPRSEDSREAGHRAGEPLTRSSWWHLS
jgi:hypothetical protein